MYFFGSKLLHQKRERGGGRKCERDRARVEERGEGGRSGEQIHMRCLSLRKLFVYNHIERKIYLTAAALW